MTARRKIRSCLLAEFLESVALVADIDNHEPEENAVVLMTLHSAKGLEFPVVFMPGMEDGLFPGWRSLDSADGVEEERRLCYVGITRARENGSISPVRWPGRFTAELILPGNPSF